MGYKPNQNALSTHKQGIFIKPQIMKNQLINYKRHILLQDSFTGEKKTIATNWSNQQIQNADTLGRYLILCTSDQIGMVA